MMILEKCLNNNRFFLESKKVLNRGFTLIELLVVIAIIGVMATMVLSQLRDARLEAQYSTAIQEMRLFRDSMYLYGKGNTRLMDITGSNCTACLTGCSGIDLRNVPNTHSCAVGWQAILDDVGAVSDLIDPNTTPLLRDPWGSPYLLDENEGERAQPQYCWSDYLRSVGPDGVSGTSDDFLFMLPFRTDTCAGLDPYWWLTVKHI